MRSNPGACVIVTAQTKPTGSSQLIATRLSYPRASSQPLNATSGGGDADEHS